MPLSQTISNDTLPQKILAAVRVKDWWYFILPPIIGFYFLGISIRHIPSNSVLIIQEVLVLLSISMPVAALGFFINEWTDINEDRIAGKNNYAQYLGKGQRTSILILLIVILAAELILFQISEVVKILVLVQILLFILYSCRPIRLKNYTITAIILDGLYSGSIFFLIALLLHATTIPTAIIWLVLIVGFIKGIRNIIYHLIVDEHHDAVSGKSTITKSIDKQTLYYLQEFMWYAESVILLRLTYLSSGLIFSLMITAVTLLLVKKWLYYKNRPDGQGKWLAELNIIYEVWLPLISIIGVFIQIGWIEPIIAVILLILVFPSTLKILSEIYLALYNLYYLGYKIYYFISDLYFIRIKPHYDIGKMIRRLKGE